MQYNPSTSTVIQLYAVFQEDLADYVCKCLMERAEMLDDYFSMEVVDDEEDDQKKVAPSSHSSGPVIRTLPMLSGRDDFSPCLSGLPLFVLRLATEVIWHEEEACFHTFIK